MVRYFSGTNDTSDTSNTANSSNASKTSTSASYIMIFWTFLLIFWMFCLGTDRTDASFTFSHNNLILNSLISISGSHKPPSQWKFHFNLQSHQSLNMIYDELRFIFDQTGKDSGRAARHGGEICRRPAVGPHWLQVIFSLDPVFMPIVSCLRDRMESSPSLVGQKCPIIFGNLEDIYQFHSQCLLPELER